MDARVQQIVNEALEHGYEMHVGSLRWTRAVRSNGKAAGAVPTRRRVPGNRDREGLRESGTWRKNILP